MRTIKIEVTQELIDAARDVSGTWAATHCPVARAVERLLGTCEVSRSKIELADGRKIPLPSKARLFVHRFDHRRREAATLAPFSFSVQVPRKRKRKESAGA